MNFNISRLPLLLFFFLQVFTCMAQVNTERFRKYYDKEGFIFNVSTNFTLKAGNSEYGAISGLGRIDYNGRNLDHFLVVDMEYKSSGKEKITNNGFVHLRSMWNFRERTNWEFFIQREYDEFVNLKSRNLAGTAIKYRLIGHTSKKDSATSFDMNVSLGLMFENEDYNLEPDNVIENLIRSTNFISFDWLMDKRLNFTGVLYYQPALRDFNDFRVAAETTFEFSIFERLYFVFGVRYKYNNKPITDVKPFDLTVKNGLRFAFQ
nr:DUF481 domain-containing protein [Bacteroidota bacterium]